MTANASAPPNPPWPAGRSHAEVRLRTARITARRYRAKVATSEILSRGVLSRTHAVGLGGTANLAVRGGNLPPP